MNRKRKKGTDRTATQTLTQIQRKAVAKPAVKGARRTTTNCTNNRTTNRTNNRTRKRQSKAAFKQTRRRTTDSSVSVVIAARNEQKALPSVLDALRRWRRKCEVIVVANGCTDNTAAIARGWGAKVIEIGEPLGHDVGRAIGLSKATGDVCLVLDADIRILPREIEPFVTAVERGADVALNRYPLFGTAIFHHRTSVAKQAINHFLGHGHLQAASLTAVPHALSRRALDTIDLESFAVPPVAQALACLRGLNVVVAAHVPVGIRNPVRRGNHRLTSLIIGDCLEAVARIQSELGVRGGFTDLNRQRNEVHKLMQAERLAATLANWQDKVVRFVGDVVAGPALHRGERETESQGPPPVGTTVAVVPAMDEAVRVGKVIQALKKTKIDEVRVVANGCRDDTVDVARRFGGTVTSYEDALGHDVGRAIGCTVARGAHRYVFLDADLPLTKGDIKPFVMGGDWDVALNDIDGWLDRRKQTDPVSTVKRFLNLAISRPDLGAASMTAIPHAVTREVINGIGADSLVVPPLAQVRAVLSGYRVVRLHAVEVVKNNRPRPRLHRKKAGAPLQKLILGDHLEALSELLKARGHRGGFTDGDRRRDLLHDWLANSGWADGSESMGRSKSADG